MDVAEVTGTMGRSGSERGRGKVAGTMGRLGSVPVDVEEAEAARGLFVGLILPTLGIAVVCTLLLGLFRSIILTLRISIVGIAI